jgi:hypothetical protein
MNKNRMHNNAVKNLAKLAGLNREGISKILDLSSRERREGLSEQEVDQLFREIVATHAIKS